MSAIEALSAINGISSAITGFLGNNPMAGTNAQLRANQDMIMQQINNERTMKLQYEYGLKGLEAQQQAEKEMFEYTGVAAKKRQFEEAGMNPALVYGMGAGGASGVTGSATAPSVTAQPVNIAAIRSTGIAMEGMALQNAKLASEIKVNEATAANLAAGVPKQGSETDLNIAKTEGQKIINQDAQTNLDILTAVKQNKIDEAVAIAKHKELNYNIDAITSDTIMNQRRETLNLTIAEVLKTKSEKQVNDAEITKINNEIYTNLEKLKQGAVGMQIDMVKIENSLRECLINNQVKLDATTITALSHLAGNLILGGALKGIKNETPNTQTPNTSIPVPKPTYYSTPSR